MSFFCEGSSRVESVDDAELSDCDAVAVSKGPGSYTGLRVGVSTAKGLCFGAGIPLIAIGTLDTLVWQAMDEGLVPEGCKYIVPMIDARRMQVYTGVFTPDGKQDSPTTAAIVTGESFQDQLAEVREEAETEAEQIRVAAKVAADEARNQARHYKEEADEAIRATIRAKGEASEIMKQAKEEAQGIIDQAAAEATEQAERTMEEAKRNAEACLAEATQKAKLRMDEAERVSRNFEMAKSM